ncbi:Site-specific DNA-methyltransferase (adenine-spe cific) [Micromonospora saelicesensis]|uniref:site-specific DNA-methyltransferase n=1 Tax=Micromonospora saelicesensis TaxID=285676 RepID=UPI000DBFA63B|nr:site-specific DNA-methyltransferase [Micromonospora saelicesensis]RAO52734.1 Site-specific DNA-methyltransferase (adenine-spe cific) [Micromonospora saelicesensis]
MTLDFEPVDDLTGPGEAKSNLDLLACLFPDAVVDGTVDIDALRDLLGDDAAPNTAEAFGLRWPGMAEARRLSTLPATGTLLPKPEESVDWETTHNIVIEGDNLEVLRLLRRGYTNKVDVIYIDPPYNTGNDFVYDDKRTTSQTEHETAAGQRDDEGVLQVGEGSDRAQDRKAGASLHTKWLSMMYPRLLVAHHLLKETGVIIVAIGDTEHARLKLMMDRVFGAENFAANVVWQGSGRNDARFTSAGIDYMLIYAKSKTALIQGNVRWTERKTGAAEVAEAARKAWEESGHDPAMATESLKKWWKNAPQDIAKGLGGSRGYKEIDENGRVFARGDLRSPNPRENLMYDLPHPVSGLPVRMHPNGWVYSRGTMAQKIAEGRILFGEDESVSPRYKRFLDELEDQPIRPVFERDRAAAGLYLRRLLGSDAFEYPKDHTVLAKWIDAVSGSNPGAVIVDFFAGSGSTGHAIMDLNAADGGNRRYILVQLDEPVDKDGYAMIADITRERLRRAGEQIASKQTPDVTDIDTGFRSYRLASSNLKAWDGTAQQLNLIEAVDNLVAGRTTDDLLVEVMLRLGVDLTTWLEKREVAGSSLYNLAGTLFAYFGTDITVERANEVAKALVAWRDEDPGDADTTVVVRDTGFLDSAAKLNFAAALEQAGFTTLRSI